MSDFTQSTTCIRATEAADLHAITGDSAAVGIPAAPVRCDEFVVKPVRGGLLARGTAQNLVGLVLPLLVGVAAMPYIIRGLGPDRFGILALIWILFNYFTIFDLGLGRAATKFVAEALGQNRLARVPCFVWLSLAIQAFFGLIGGALLIAVTPALTGWLLRIPPALVHETRTTSFILAISLPVMMVTNGLRAVLEGCQRFDYVNLLKIPASTLSFLLPAIAVSLGFGLPGIVFLLLMSRCVFTAAHLVVCLRALPVLRHAFAFDAHWIRPLLLFGSWVAVGNVINPILVYMDRLLIGVLLPVAMVGYYTAPFEVITKVWIIPTSLAAVLFPACSALGTDQQEQLKALYSRSIKYLFIALIPIVVILAVFSHEILQAWLGSHFAAESSAALRLLAVGVFVNCLSHVPYSFLQGLGRPDLPAKLFVVELPVYAPLAWGMISRFAINGAAMAWTLRVTAECIVLLVFAWKTHRLSPDAASHPRLRQAFVLAVALAGALTCGRIAASRSLPLAVLAMAMSLAGFLWAAWRYVADCADRASLINCLSLLLRPLGGRTG